MGSKLEWLAQDMRAAAIRSGFSRRELARGLVLDLSVGFDTPPEKPIGELTVAELEGASAPVWWILTLSRPAVEPSDREVAIVRSAFGIPAEVESNRGDGRVWIRWPMD